MDDAAFGDDKSKNMHMIDIPKEPKELYQIQAASHDEKNKPRQVYNLRQPDEAEDDKLEQKSIVASSNEDEDDDDEITKSIACTAAPMAIGLLACLFSNTRLTNQKSAKIILGLTACAIVVGYVACLASLKVRKRRKTASKILGKVGCSATVAAFVFLLSVFLPTPLLCIPILIAIFSAVVLSL